MEKGGGFILFTWGQMGNGCNGSYIPWCDLQVFSNWARSSLTTRCNILGVLKKLDAHNPVGSQDKAKVRL